MSTEKIPALLSPLLTDGKISQDTYDKTVANYEHFLSHRDVFLAANPNALWIASLGGKLYAALKITELFREISAEPNSHCAYIEQIPKAAP